jgi:hypothetical protein
MRLDTMRDLMGAHPFRPFTVSTGDGREVLVPHHDYAWLNPSGTVLFIEQLNGRGNLIFTDQITRINLDPSTSEVPPGAGTEG